MLEQLMNEIRAGGTLETNSLAKKLGVSPIMVQVMLEHLQRSGQIMPYSACSDGCQGCQLKSDCGAGGHAGQMQLWQSMGK
ncbi:MAG TPA: FeoC-like transcriptional regulator [Anaerolineales bacterium]|jgi:hypothetical protein